jgi:hypothetical protein
MLNLNSFTYLVKFQWKSTDNRFIVQGSDLCKVLKNNDGLHNPGVEYIKEFDCKDNKFKRVSKQTILNRYKWDTESYLYLTNHYFFR